jgi:tRNA pseudouridine65 synthase
MEIQILLQTAKWIAVDKPEGISVHNNEDPTNLLLVLERQLSVPKLYPVHRLDKETSGVQILALNDSSARELSVEFQNKSVSKLYVGVLRGQLKTEKGIWRQALSDKAEGRKNPSGISKDRFPCETRFRTLKETKYFTLCEFDLITGRQHQIRKHAALANHSIVGDPRYGDKNYNLKMAKLYKTPRMFLHCSEIKLSGQTLLSPAPKKFGELVSSPTLS